MKLNIVIEVKDNGERYVHVAENKFSPFKFVVVQSGKVHSICICERGNLKPECRLPYLLVYKSTFYDQKISPKNCPQLIHQSHTMT